MSRVPAGVPTGGQFAASAKNEADVALSHSLDPDQYDGYPEDYDEPPTCSICDGVGHGYPGGPPCPLEVDEAQYWETDAEERLAAEFGLPW